jgi:hypothetical protein
VQIRAVRWVESACIANLTSPSATTTISPTGTPSQTSSRTPSTTPSASPASLCNIRTVAGTGSAGSTGDGGQGTSATLNGPHDVYVNGSALLIAEQLGARVRHVDLLTGVATTVAGSGGSSGSYLGVAATSANLGVVSSVIVLPSGDMAMGSYTRCTMVAVAAQSQLTYSVAGTGSCLSSGSAAGTGVAANGTAFGKIRFMALWSGDGLFVSTWEDHRVRLVNLTTGAARGWGGGGGVGWHAGRCRHRPRPSAPIHLCRCAGLVDTWVNSAGTSGVTGDGGAAVSARLNQPNGLVVYGGSLLVADQISSVIRAVDLSSRIIMRWAGTGTASSTGDGLDKLAATFHYPYGLALLPDGSVLMAQFGGCQVTRITPAGVVRRFAGSGTCSPSNGDGSSAVAANVHGPVAMAYDNSTGTVYMTEYDGHKVREGEGGGGQDWHVRANSVVDGEARTVITVGFWRESRDSGALLNQPQPTMGPFPPPPFPVCRSGRSVGSNRHASPT